MTNEQARDILQTIQHRMELNGYGEIFQIVTIRLEEEFVQNHTVLRESNSMMLKFYLNNIMAILRTLSSSSLTETISTINQSIGEKDIKSSLISNIVIELVNEQTIDLSELPDYSELIVSISEILELINQE